MKAFTIIVTLLLGSFMGKAQDTVSYIKYAPCMFYIDLPAGMEMSKMNESSPDYCDYEVKLKDGYVIMELHSLLSTRYDLITLQEFYDAALKSDELDITYKMLASNYFVISGIDKKNGNIVYWKRVVGKFFISEMDIEYDKSRKTDIEPYIGNISKSFTGD